MAARESRQVWLIVLALVFAVCAEAIAVPAKAICPAVRCHRADRRGIVVTGRQRQRREHAALTARLAALSRDDVPADVIELVAADKKIRAIKRYRELTGVGLRKASAVIGSL